MLSALVIVVLVVGVGARMGDNLRLRQQEAILQKLPEPDAIAYYELLRRRVRKVLLLRAVALVSVFAIFYAYKYRLIAPKGTPPAATAPAAPR